MGFLRSVVVRNCRLYQRRGAYSNADPVATNTPMLSETLYGYAENLGTIPAGKLPTWFLVDGDFARYRKYQSYTKLNDMTQKNTLIEISLRQIAPHLLVQMGEREYLSWSQQVVEQIRAKLSSVEQDQLNVTIDTKPLRGTRTKSGLLAIGAIGITLVGYLGASEKTTKLLTALWSGLKKAFQENPKNPTSLEFEVDTTFGDGAKSSGKLKISANDAEAVLTLLRAVKSQEVEGSTLRITPKNK